jgi:hypothetical protein
MGDREKGGSYGWRKTDARKNKDLHERIGKARLA